MGLLRDETTDRQAKPSRADEHLASVLGAVAELNDTMGQVHKGLKTMRGVMQLGADNRQLTGVSQKLSHMPGTYAGFAMRETTGTAPALVRIRDSAHGGADGINGDILDIISLAQGESARDWFMPGGKAFAFGLFVEVVTGSVEGVVFLGTSL